MTTTPGLYRDLTGRVAVVTGGSRGVGSGIARELARQGVRVVVNGRDRAAIDAVAGEITATGGVAIGVNADVTDEAAVRRLRRAADDAFGPVDIVVACAGGLGQPVPLADLTTAAWEAAVSVNLTSAFLTFREFVPPMAERGVGAVVTIASTAGRAPGLASPAYAAAKAGLIMLSRHTAQEVAAAGVRINTIALGSVLEGKPVPPSVLEHAAQAHPLGRTGTFADVASTVAFLVSDASAWLTGTTVDLSGGRVTL